MSYLIVSKKTPLCFDASVHNFQDFFCYIKATGQSKCSPLVHTIKSFKRMSLPIN